jgi:hypothetical protein
MIKHCVRNTGLQQWFVTKVNKMKIFWENNILVIIFLIHNVNKCTEKLPVSLLSSTYTWSLKKPRWNHCIWLTCCVRNCPPLSRLQHIIVNYVTHFCEIPSFAWRQGCNDTLFPQAMRIAIFDVYYETNYSLKSMLIDMFFFYMRLLTY